MFVKICGLTSPDQARAVVQMGADAIGLVFAASKRQVTIERAAKVVAAAGREVATVGVFVDAPAGEINRVVERTGITRVQLHGKEPADIVAHIAVPCWKAFRVRDDAFAGQIRDWLAAIPGGADVESILLDTHTSTAAGGTGEAFNWNLLKCARDEGNFPDGPRILLAGGLTPENVAEAVRIAQPGGVDVSSGVESSLGVKDLSQVEAFLRAAKGR